MQSREHWAFAVAVAVLNLARGSPRGLFEEVDLPVFSSEMRARVGLALLLEGPFG